MEHAYPCGILGWLVLVLKRHAEALHSLTDEEFQELGELQGKTAKVLHRALGCGKEYVACFTEAEGFNHVHFHIVPRSNDLPDSLRGTKIFTMLKVDRGEAVSPDEIAEFCIDLQKEYNKG